MSILGPSSGWKFVTSQTLSGVGGQVILAGPQGGTFVVQDSNGANYDLNFGGVGAGGGISPVPIPAGAAFSLRCFPSSGIGDIWLGPARGGTLSPEDFIGPCNAVKLGTSIGAARARALIIFGAYVQAPAAAIVEALIGLIWAPALPPGRGDSPFLPLCRHP